MSDGAAVTDGRGFRDFYRRRLHPAIRVLEAARHRRLVSYAAVSLFLAAALAAAVALGLSGGWLDGAVIAVGCAALSFRLAPRYLRKTGIGAEAKKALLGEIAANACPGLSYSPEAGIDMGAFLASGLFARPIDDYHAEDLFRHVGEKFAFSEVRAREKVELSAGMSPASYGDGGNESGGFLVDLAVGKLVDGSGRGHISVDVFSGVFCVASLSCSFPGFMTLFPERGIRAVKGKVGKAGHAWYEKPAGEEVAVGDEEFDRFFSAYASDADAARKVLTPRLQTLLLDLRRRGGYHYLMSCAGDTLYLALPYADDRFEFDLLSPLTDSYAPCFRFNNDIAFFAAFIREAAAGMNAALAELGA